MTNRIIAQFKLKDLLHYNPDTGIFTWIKARRRINVGDVAGNLNKKGYIKICIDGVQYFAHRLAWVYVYNELPNESIDHIDMIKTNNKISNLRLAYGSINNQNMKFARKDNKSSNFIGVSKMKGYDTYRASIRVDGKKKHLGVFPNELIAYESYVKAKRAFHVGCTI